MVDKVITPEFRVSYPNVFQARKNELSGKDEFSLTAMFPKTADLSALKRAAEAVLVEKLGADKSKWPANMRNPFRKNSEKYKNVDGKTVAPQGMEDPDGIFINIKAQQKPGVVDQNVQPIIEPREFYAGCYAIASVRPYFYDQKGNKGVAFGLNNIQKVRDGEPLGGVSRPEDDFKPAAGGGASPTTGAASVFD